MRFRAPKRAQVLLQIADHSVPAEPSVRDPELHIVEVPLVQRQLEEVLLSTTLCLFLDMVHELYDDTILYIFAYTEYV